MELQVSYTTEGNFATIIVIQINRIVAENIKSQLLEVPITKDIYFKEGFSADNQNLMI